MLYTKIELCEKFVTELYANAMCVQGDGDVQNPQDPWADAEGSPGEVPGRNVDALLWGRQWGTFVTQLVFLNLGILGWARLSEKLAYCRQIWQRNYLYLNNEL